MAGGGPHPLAAATIVVNTTEDELNSDGDCSLREAIRSANLDTAVDGCVAGSGADDIVFAPSVVPGTFALTLVETDEFGDSTEDAALTGDLDITDNVTITGAGAELTIIDGGGFAGLDDRIFDIAPASEAIVVTITGVTIMGGVTHASDTGAGIRNRGTLTLRESRITGNATGTSDGAGIVNVGTLTLIASHVTDNSVADSGGGIVTGALFSGSDPIDQSRLTLMHSTVSSNSAQFSGGGLLVLGGTVTVMHSIINQNGADTAGGISNGRLENMGGTVQILHSTVSHNFGLGACGIINRGTLQLEHSTIDGNGPCDAFGGGGITNIGTATVINSTISNNQSGLPGGGGFMNEGTLTITNSTVSHNSAGLQGGGGVQNNGGTVTLHNTILAQNVSFFDGPDCIGVISSLGHNLLGDPTACDIVLDATDRTGDPRLGLFTDLGTPGTGHFPLRPSSPAIDAGDTAACPPTDQLGQPREDGNGDGTTVCDIGAIEFQPQQARALLGIASHFEHGCVINADETLRCWGEASYGRLGNGATAPPQLTPIPVPLTEVAQVEAGIHQTCAVKHDGTAWCWGNGSNYRLGSGTTNGQLLPRQVATLTNVAEIATNGTFSCARKYDGTAWCSGDGNDGQLGYGGTSTQRTPVQVSQVSGLFFISQIAVSDRHTCAVTINGTAWCWGANGHGQIGDGTTTRRTLPTFILGGATDVAQVVAGAHHSCARTIFGSVLCWGEDGRGEVGDGPANMTPKLRPVQVPGLSDVTSISSQVWHTCAVKTDGTVWCWGQNSTGQLGDGTTTDRHAPVQVVGLTDVAQVSAGYYASCALKHDGTAWCWGAGGSGRLGNGSTTGSLIPVQVLNIP